MAYKFVNPYSFFPLSEEKQVVGDLEAKRYSGVIHYSLRTKTPLFIPDSEKSFREAVIVKKENKEEEEKKEHLHNVFMSRNDLSEKEGDISELSDAALTAPQDPFIPGSEVRGLFRSIYEILTDSCLSTLDDEDILSKRTNEVFCAGLLRKESEGHFMLYKADDCIFRADRTGSVNDAPAGAYRPNPRTGKREYIDFNTKSYRIDTKAHPDFTDGQKVYIQTAERDRGKTIAKHLSSIRTADSPTEGYLLKGLNGPDMGNNAKAAKHNCHIFVLDRSEKAVEVDLKILDDVLRIYKENEVNTYAEYARGYAAFKKGEIGAYFPVYYSKIEIVGSVYLSPSAITREIYTRRIKDAVHGMTPCDGKKRMCPACRLFGTIKTEQAFSSRIRFADLSFVGSNHGDHPDYIGPKTLIPLSTPKISNMEFYLQRPAADAVFWTYDYYIDVNGRIHPNTSAVNGRKFYWNHAGEILTAEQKTDQNKTVYPLNEGNVFHGELYFNGVTGTELENLIYILNCGESADASLQEREHCYKLGAGKPAGLGSVAVKVDSVFSREQSSDAAYSVKPYKTTGEHSLKHLDQFAVMTGFVTEKVDYPRTEPNGDIFAWYSDNHKGYRYNRDAGRNDVIGKPNSRTQEFFARYLVPLKTELGRIPIPGTSVYPNTSIRQAGSENGGGSDRQRDRSRNNTPHKQESNGGNAPICPACSIRERGYNQKTGSYFPLCTQCNNNKVSVTCSQCGAAFMNAAYFANRPGQLCPACRKKRR